MLWASVLRGALQRHSTVLQGSNALEAKAVLEAVLLYGQQRGTFHCGAVAMGTKEEILASIIMEEVLPYLQDQLFPRKIMPQSWRRVAWMKFLAAAYDRVFAQVGTEMTALMETWAQERPLLEKQVRADLHEITALQDSISRKMTGG
ncbi:protein Niban-like [Scleropages formosus]|uniref:protein Niban-like n=1 Tax=Scleropages formosus TaxID=113540 RepID=UPI000878EA20|nr:protein Niban-like [Scleropages formosus]